MDNDQLEKQQLEDKLRQMPKIKDNQSKETLYQKIELRLHEKQEHRRWSWLVPSIASFAVIGLLFLIVQGNMNRSYQNANESYSEQASTEEQEQSNVQFDQPEGIEEKSSLFSADEEQEKREITNNNQGSSLIYYKNVDEEKLFTIAAVDKYNNYAIPITLVDSSGGSANDYYNKINRFIADKQEALGLNVFPFDGLSFDIDVKNKRATLIVPESYRFPDGSSSAYVFEQMATIMFKPYGIQKLNIQSPDGNPVNLGPFGEISAIDIMLEEKHIYKIYQYNEKEPLLVPIKTNTDDTIEAALKQLKIDEPAFDVKGPIPEDASFDVVVNQDNLSLHFTEGPTLADDETTIMMIEAILMTAKSFNFDSITIDLPNDLDKVGKYRLNQTIPVPDGVNPNILH
ncbi:GerMN domain-containing protein [Paraliobacillus salinarum]|uniref:GerMN domain-containing protein n=1 Tax=Paraliobacillus salinarum TaxID=1158996 RepID=UPI0015F69424|nr:GerMN domain-containing protein [Paraliobacillus salinarum]